MKMASTKIEKPATKAPTNTTPKASASKPAPKKADVKPREPKKKVMHYNTIQYYVTQLQIFHYDLDLKTCVFSFWLDINASFLFLVC